MFTSRAERRLLLRQDNAFLRLTDRAYNLGLIDSNMYEAFKKEKELIHETIASLKIGKNSSVLLNLFDQESLDKEKIYSVIGQEISDRVLQTIHAEILYAPYLVREEKEVQKAQQYQALEIPEYFPFKDLPGLSKELQEKLNKHKPKTIAQASLIPGMTPAAISLLIFKVRELVHKKPTFTCQDNA
jgi:tRNA uridine 5-carboxymethylaminomethyl modification enzyme